MDTQSVFRKQMVVATAVSAAIGLAACGSGGGGSDSTTFAGTTAGKAAKGIIWNGLVTAQELNVSGGVVRSFDPVLTDENGDYTLVIGADYDGGPILLTIAPNDDPAVDTQMKCDVLLGCDVDGPLGPEVPINHGEWIINPDFEMQAILASAESGQEVSAQITPFTHMAASRVLADIDGVGVTASSVYDAISEVNQIVGVNIMNVEPVDITDTTAAAAASADDLVYATFVAGLGDLLFSNDDGLVGGLEDLAAAFSDGDIDSEDAFAITDLTDAVLEQSAQLDSTDEDAVDALDDIDTAIAVIESTTTDDGTYNPEPTDSADLSAVEQAKALVSETRTWVSSVEELESPADAFAGNLELAADIVDAESQGLFEVLGNVVGDVFDELDVRSNSDTGIELGTFEVPVFLDFGELIGTVTVTLADNDGMTIAISGTDLNGDVDVELNVASNIPSTEYLVGQPFTLNTGILSASGSIANPLTSISLNDASLTVSVSEPVTVTDLENEITDPLEWESLITGIEFSGGTTIAADISTFTGNVAVSLVALDEASADDPIDPNPISLSEISLDGVFADPDDSLTAVVGLTINNAATFDTIALLDQLASVNVDETEGFDTFGFTDFAETQGVTLISASYDADLDQTCASTLESGFGCVLGDTAGTQALLLSMYPEAIDVSIDVFYDAASNVTSWSGKLEFSDFETAENFADVTLTASLDLALDGFPDASLVITVNRTELEGGDATLTFVYDGQSLTVEVDKPDAADATGLVTVTNPDGVELALSGLTDADDSISGTVTVNGVQVGTVSETDDGLVILRYDDGTFESLN